MKDPLKRTKVVIRQLPPSLSKTDLLSQIDGRFFDCYNWFCFRPGKFSQKNQRYSRAYINFKRPEDVFEFAEFFNGHVFVNEKGHQFKTIVEYAPSQLVPKPCARKDSREGTIYKDPDYLEFIKLIAKPVEHLPSAEIQLERKEAEQSGTGKEDPVITPLMDFVRKKRAAGNGTRASFGKVSRRNGQKPSSKHGSPATKRISENKKYIQKDSIKNRNRKDKSNATSAARREDQPATLTAGSTEGSITGITLNADSGKKKILLLKGKEHEIPNVSEGMLPQPGVISAGESMPISIFQKQNQRREAGGRMIRSILQKNEPRQSQSSTAVQPQQKIPNLNLENGKQSQRATNARGGSVGHVPDDKSPALDSEGEAKRTSVDRFMKKDIHGLDTVSQKQEKRVRTRDRPDRGVWAPLRRSDVPPSQESISPTVTQSTQSPTDSVEGSRRHFGHHGPANLTKDESSLNTTDGKHSKRGGAAGFGVHEKQMWVQKTS
ncbi:regulator of nonsense transcripts UPF3 [Tripterygium wilfordii]|uniref:Regulator of nonsense transcripts UPF3 n=1 Tax=Tripterygium wilfordii TaxID=458696 RepID=A0A7J7DD76_TRIWF|nr:regulator of nonsense transcripts UPF3-like [Tripterygium wilfordii]KAF5744208.1 regulator of nonsense transcripts UPF3 [Tripterygium wilfordii]